VTNQPEPEPTPGPAQRALRAHDIHQGLHLVDRNVGLVGSELETTQLVGMAAALASAIKGQEVVTNAVDLKTVAAEQLDIDRWAFPGVIRLLEEVDYVRNVQKGGDAIVSFYENVPESFERLYESLGAAWTARGPGEIEQSLIATVENLSFGPRRVEDLNIDPTARQTVLELGRDAEAIQLVTVGQDTVAHSPFFAFEHPESMEKVLASQDVDSVRSAFDELRRRQGVAIDLSPNSHVLRALVSAGLVAAPALKDPSGKERSFAIAAYGLRRSELLTVRKPVLDKARAIIGSVRMGEHFGGVTNLKYPIAFLRRLQDPWWTSSSHSSIRRQYAALYRMGIIRFTGAREMSGIQLIDTPDNAEALALAIELLAFGEATSTREAPIDASEGLQASGTYRYPIQTVRASKSRRPLPDGLMEAIYESAMSRTLL
jgi:hypothetical protein